MTNIAICVSICLLALSVEIYGIMRGKPLKSFKHYGFQVGILYQGQFISAGCIINRKIILTSASTLYPIRHDPEIEVVAGRRHLKYKDPIFPVEKLILHGDYNDDTKENNIALVKLRKRIKYHHKLFAALVSYEDVPDYAVVEMGGWGLQSSNHHYQVATFNVVNVPVKDVHTCRRMYANKGITDVFIPNSSLCTYTTRGKGTCSGDTGGPVLYNKKVVGIIGEGQACTTKLPDVHTRLFKYEAWILKICIAEH